MSTTPLRTRFAPEVHPLEDRLVLSAGGQLDPLQTVVADFNRDGLADLAAVRDVKGGGGGGGGAGGVFLEIYLNDRKGGFEVRKTFVLPHVLEKSGSILAVGDINNDGFADIAVAGPGAQPHVKLMAGDGRGGFEERRSFVLPHVLEKSGRFLAVGDLDGDGRSDIVIGDSASIIVQPGSGAGPLVRTNPLGGGVFVAAGDLDGDGRAELVGRDGGTLQFAEWEGDPVKGDFAIVGQTTAYADDKHKPPDQAFLVDVNRDGALDLVVLAGHEVHVGVNQTRGAEGAPHTFKWSSSSLDVGLGIFIAAGDVDGDGVIDLFTVQSTGQKVGYDVAKNVKV